MTLSQAANTGLGGVINLILLSGNHNLSSNLEVRGVVSFSMRPIEADSKVAINCAPFTKLEFSYVTKVSIYGVILKGCVHTTINAVNDFIMEDSKLLGGHIMTSSGLTIRSSRLSIIRASFSLFKSSFRRKDMPEGSVLHGWNSTVDVISHRMLVQYCI